MKANEKPHYVNNAQFSAAVVDYVTLVRQSKTEDNAEKPKVTNYIAECFLKIAEGLSHKANFVRYTYREEMVMDAVENCLKAIENYNLEVATRTGKPNAFAYFTQIAWYAFLRRIQKEKKQVYIKQKSTIESALTLDSFTTIDGIHDPTLINTNVEWMNENMNHVEYTPRKSKRASTKNNLETNFSEEEE